MRAFRPSFIQKYKMNRSWTKTGQILDKAGDEKVEIQASLWYKKYLTVKISNNSVGLE